MGEQVLARNHVLHTANAERFWTRDYCTTLIAQHAIILTNRKRRESCIFLLDIEHLQGLITWTLVKQVNNMHK